jgi:hypothetical protein
MSPKIRQQLFGPDELLDAAPRADHTYAATVTYDAGLYNVEIRKIDPHGAPGRKIEHRSLSECRRA